MPPHVPRRAGKEETQATSPRSPRSPQRHGPMPQVFRRLTAPVTPRSDEMARIAVANMGAKRAQVSFGGGAHCRGVSGEHRGDEMAIFVGFSGDFRGFSRGFHGFERV